MKFMWKCLQIGECFFAAPLSQRPKISYGDASAPVSFLYVKWYRPKLCHFNAEWFYPIFWMTTSGDNKGSRNHWKSTKIQNMAIIKWSLLKYGPMYTVWLRPATIQTYTTTNVAHIIHQIRWKYVSYLHAFPLAFLLLACNNAVYLWITARITSMQLSWLMSKIHDGLITGHVR